MFFYISKIDFPEFLMLMTSYNAIDNEDFSNDEDKTSRMMKEREEELCDMFMMFDKDMSGSISVDELSKVMVKFGGLDKNELDIMIRENDSDGDGQVSNGQIKCQEKSVVKF